MQYMDLKTLLNQLTQNLKYILLFTLLGAVLGLGLVLFIPNTYTATIIVYVHKEVEDSEPDVYSYDGYYAQQASEAYTDTVASVFESGDIMSVALSEQNIPSSKFKSFQRSLKVQKVAPQLIEVKLTREDQVEARDVLQAISLKVKDKIYELNNVQVNQYLIDQVNQDPLLTFNQIPWLVTVLVGLLLGFGGSVFVIVVGVYVNNNES